MTINLRPYQAVRRCYRFGQTKPVHVYLFTAENEGQVLFNLKRKEKQHHIMSEKMTDHMGDIMKNELTGQTKITEEYREDVFEGDKFTIHLSDCVKLAKKLDDNSIDYSVFSPPFAGIGSEGYCAVKMGRRFVGSELKPQYWHLACQNISEAKVEQRDLFSA